MIRKLEIKNFQSHSQSSLSLHPGVNIIKGSSDCGKSSIVRALRWLLMNRPLGFDYRSTFANKEDDTTVWVEFDDGELERVRSPKENFYTTENSKLQAMKGEVPQEVQDLTRITEVNLQSQHDSPFLLTETPGQVGRMLNEVVGIDIIDEVLSRVRRILQSTNDSIKEATQKEEGLQTKIEKLSFVDQMEKDVQELSKLDEQYTKLAVDFTRLDRFKISLKDAQERIRVLKEWLTVKTYLEKMEKLVESVPQLDSKMDRLVALQKKLSDLYKITSRLKRKLKVRDIIQGMAKLEDTMQILYKNLTDQKKLYTSMSSIMVVQGRHRIALGFAQKQLKSSLQKIDKCPVCKQSVNEEQINEIINNW